MSLTKQQQRQNQRHHSIASSKDSAIIRKQPVITDPTRTHTVCRKKHNRVQHWFYFMRLWAGFYMLTAPRTIGLSHCRLDVGRHGLYFASSGVYG
jgi:hypothetical protein